MTKKPTEHCDAGPRDPEPGSAQEPADCGTGWRLAFLDAAYHPSGQQSLGLAAAIAWSIPRTPRRDRALQRLTERSFSTNGMLSGLVAGPFIREIEVPAARLPERGAQTRKEGRAENPPGAGAGGADDAVVVAVDRAAGSLAPPVASIGDRLVTGALLPALSVALIVSALWGPALLVVCVLVYCGIQVYWRRLAWHVGIRGEAGVLRLLRDRPFDRWIARLRSIARFVLGFVVGGILVGQGETPVWMAPVVFAVLAVLGWGLARTGGLGPHRIGGFVLVLSLLLHGVIRLL